MMCSIEGCGERAHARGWCRAHYLRWYRTGDPHPPPVVDRFWAKVGQQGGCWMWLGHRDRHGYGRVGSLLAHRVAYEDMVGPIPPGLTLDHLCKTPSCVRPDHMDPVPLRVNILRGSTRAAMNARKTECKWGHPLVGENLLISAGARHCRACNRRRSAELKQRKIAKAAA